MSSKPAVLLTALLLALVPATAFAGGPPSDHRIAWDEDWCDRGGHHGDAERHCEVREMILSTRGTLTVDGAKNGGVRVEGWDGSEIQVQARVETWADDEADARARAGEIEIDTGDTLIARGPEQHRRGGWSVSYRIRVPRFSSLDLATHNGGISIAGVSGEIRFSAKNGGVTLADLGGDVQGKTTNGGLKVELAGNSWDGEGLDVETTNGGVSLWVPEGYSAELTTGTVNGGLNVDFPMTVQGRVDKRLHTTLGAGGPPVRVITTNGGVKVRSL